MTTKKLISFAVFLLAAWLLLGCNLASRLPAIGLGGSGNNLIKDATTGLKTLQSYHVSFSQDLNGDLAGKPYEKHMQLELTKATGQVDFSRQLDGTEDPASFFRVISRDNANYQWFSQDGGCAGEAGKAEESVVLEPASLLPALKSPKLLGTEDVNGLSARHYEFTQADMAIAEPKPEVSGEVWIAENGGFVVKFQMSVSTPAKPDKEGLSVSQEWDYEISQVNTIQEIDMPEGCMEVPLDIPVMADAQEVKRSSGLVSYSTGVTAAEVVQFYEDKLAGLGWTSTGPTPANDAKLPLSIIIEKGEERLSLTISPGDPSGLDIDITLFRLTAARGTTGNSTGSEGTSQPNPNPTPGAEVSQVESGLPEDIPLYPGVTDLFKTGNTIRVTSSNPVSSIADFYSQQMPARGWTLFNSQNPNDAVLQIWQKESRVVSIMITPNNPATFLVITQEGN